jgi:hypothetical protein
MDGAETRRAADRPVRSMQRSTDAENCKQTSEKQCREAETRRTANRQVRRERRRNQQIG